MNMTNCKDISCVEGRQGKSKVLYIYNLGVGRVYCHWSEEAKAAFKKTFGRYTLTSHGYPGKYLSICIENPPRKLLNQSCWLVSSQLQLSQI